jgi:NhaP-type Na+/H+ or K+/H+ antiporter
LRYGIRTQLTGILAACALGVYLGSFGGNSYGEMRIPEFLGTLIFVCTWLWAAFVSGRRKSAAFWGFALAYWLIPAAGILLLDLAAQSAALSGFWESVRVLFSYFIFTTIYGLIYLARRFDLSPWAGAAAVFIAVALCYGAGLKSRRRYIFGSR